MPNHMQAPLNIARRLDLAHLSFILHTFLLGGVLLKGVRLWGVRCCCCVRRHRRGCCQRGLERFDAASHIRAHRSPRKLAPRRSALSEGHLDAQVCALHCMLLALRLGVHLRHMRVESVELRPNARLVRAPLVAEARAGLEAAVRIALCRLPHRRQLPLPLLRNKRCGEAPSTCQHVSNVADPVVCSKWCKRQGGSARLQTAADAALAREPSDSLRVNVAALPHDYAALHRAWRAASGVAASRAWAG